jgi:hypothetical protein
MQVQNNDVIAMTLWTSKFFLCWLCLPSVHIQNLKAWLLPVFNLSLGNGEWEDIDIDNVKK